MIPDPLTAVQAYLKADADVATQVDTRVFGGGVPAGENASMPRKAIVVRPAGGIGLRSWAPLGQPRVDVLSYGGTEYEARQVHWAAHEALRDLYRQVHGNVLLHHATPGGGPLSLREDGTDWPFVLSTWVVMANEVAAA